MARKKHATATGKADLPHNLYMQIQYMLKDYDRLQKERSDLLNASPPPPDGMPRSDNTKADPTGRRAVRLAFIDAQLAAFDAAMAQVQARYACRVHTRFDPLRAYWNYEYFNYVFLRKDGGDAGPSRRQWNYYKTLLSRAVAEQLHML